MKQMNPFYRKQWEKDQELGPTYTQRIEELELLESRLTSYTPDDQLRWAMQLETLIQSDPSPELRARAVQALVSRPCRYQTLPSRTLHLARHW